MHVIEILQEAREAPLYHYTLEPNFFRILATDTLAAPGSVKLAHGGVNPIGRIYFTRDYRRQFSPQQILKGTWGFRVNQGLLHQRYGKRLHAGGQNKWSEKERQAWLADPKNAEYVKNPDQHRGISVGGADLKDIISGNTGQASRWESEEHLDIGQLPDFHEYITGIVYAGGNANEQMYGNDFTSRNPRQHEALDKFCLYLMGHFKGEAGFKKRDQLMDYMTKFNIPFVYQQQDFPATQVKDRMIEIYRDRKAEKARRAETDKTNYILITNTYGGGITSTGPSDPQIAAQQAINDMPHKFPNGILGFRKFSDNEITWFNGVYKNPKMLPDIPMTGHGTPPKEYTKKQTAPA